MLHNQPLWGGGGVIAWGKFSATWTCWRHWNWLKILPKLFIDLYFAIYRDASVVWGALACPYAYPPPPLQSPSLSCDGLPNTCEATFALMRCQCDSSNTNRGSKGMVKDCTECGK